MEEKRVKIKVFAVVAAGDGEESGDKETLRMTSEGQMLLEDGRIAIRYDELLGDAGPSVSTLSFAVSEPKTVTLVREGGVSSVMTFSDGARLGGNYNAEFALLEFTVATKSIRNSITFERGGVLLLDYSTEMQGVAVQTSKFRFDVSLADEETRLSHRKKRLTKNLKKR